MDKKTLDLLVGRSIRVDRGGPESRMGKLLAVKDDHIVIFNEDDGMLYYRIDHIKSLSLDTRDYSDVVANGQAEQTYIPQYIDRNDFLSVVKEMQFHWVQINRGGPEKLEGVLIEATDNAVTVIVGNEVITVLPFHIRNISYGMKKNKEEKKEDKKQNDNSSNDASSSDKKSNSNGNNNGEKAKK